MGSEDRPVDIVYAEDPPDHWLCAPRIVLRPTDARGWMGIYPRTEELRVIERYRRTEYGFLELEVTAEDPTVFKTPWIQNLPLELVPQEELIEYVCENDKWGQS